MVRVRTRQSLTEARHWQFVLQRGSPASSPSAGRESIGRTFKEALQKGLRSLEIGRHGLGADGKDPAGDSGNKKGLPFGKPFLL